MKKTKKQRRTQAMREALAMVTALTIPEDGDRMAWDIWQNKESEKDVVGALTALAAAAIEVLGALTGEGEEKILAHLGKRINDED